MGRAPDFSPAQVNRALDFVMRQMVEADAEEPPRGALSGAARLIGCDRSTVWEWWRERQDAAQRAKREERARKHMESARAKAAEYLDDCVSHLGDLTKQSDTPVQAAAGTRALLEVRSGKRGADVAKRELVIRFEAVEREREREQPRDALPGPVVIEADEEEE